MSFRIYIPTKGRVDRQITLEYLPTFLPVTLVCPPKEKKELAARTVNKKVEIITCSDEMTIAEKRAWITKRAKEDYIFMMDDDLRLYVNDHGSRFSAKEATVQALNFWEYVFPLLRQRYDAVSFGTTFFPVEDGGTRENYHMGYAFGFRREVAMRVIKWNRVDSYEDIDYTLQLLRAGIRIGVTYAMMVEQRKAMAPGGCTEERSADTIDHDMKRLIELHPGIVSYKPLSDTAKHMASNIRVAWRKAAQEGGM